MMKNSLVLATLFLCGCHNSASAPPAAADSYDAFSRLPKAVANAFRSDHPGIAPTRVLPRLYPDNSVHFDISFVDKSGQPQHADYRADGSHIDHL